MEALLVVDGSVLHRVGGVLEPGGTGENPGIGGTEFTALQLAARMLQESTIAPRLVTATGPASQPPIAGVPVARVADLGELAHEPDAVVIAPLSAASRFDDVWRGRRLVVVVHHPHDFARIEPVVDRLRPAAVVSVSRYSFHSVRCGSIRHEWIPTPFPRWAVRSMAVHSGQLRTFGFIGALDPAKGFHLIAQQWPAIRRRIPGARLDVIGSASLYGIEDGHRLIPTTAVYGDRILDALGRDRDSVTFHGLVSEGKLDLMSTWDAALLNPTGLSEANPSSLKEPLAAGIPPIASDDYGMWDLMRHFPELAVKRPRALPDLVARLAADSSWLPSFERRRRVVVDEELKRDDLLVEAWTRLLNDIESGRRTSGLPVQFEPLPPSGRIGRRLSVRRARVLRTIPPQWRELRGLATSISRRLLRDLRLRRRP